MTTRLVPIYTIYIIYINPKKMKKPKVNQTALQFVDEILGWADRNQQDTLPIEVLRMLRPVLVKVGGIKMLPTPQEVQNANEASK